MSQTVDLFTEHVALSVPPGQVNTLRTGEADYQSGFISAEEKKALIDVIDRQHWAKDLRRRVQHYGYRYDYKERKATGHDDIG